MEELRDTTEQEAFPETERARLIPLASLVLVTSAYFFRWGGGGLRSVWSAVFFFSAFAYFLAIIYKASLIYRIRNALVSTGIISVLFGALIIASGRILYNVTGEAFIPNSCLGLSFATGTTLAWLGILIFTPSFCSLYYQNELTLHSSNGLISLVRRNTTAALLWAIFLGIVLYGTYSFVNILLIASGKELVVNYLNRVNPSDEWISIFAVTLNLFINLVAVLPAAILCAYLLVTVLIDQEKLFDLVMASSYMLAVLNPWLISDAPSTAIRISMAVGPALNSIVIVLIVWLFVRLRKNKKLPFLWPTPVSKGNVL